MERFFQDFFKNHLTFDFCEVYLLTCKRCIHNGTTEQRNNGTTEQRNNGTTQENLTMTTATIESNASTTAETLNPTVSKIYVVNREEMTEEDRNKATSILQKMLDSKRHVSYTAIKTVGEYKKTKTTGAPAKAKAKK